jgi:hypothetical protein
VYFQGWCYTHPTRPTDGNHTVGPIHKNNGRANGRFSLRGVGCMAFSVLRGRDARSRTTKADEGESIARLAISEASGMPSDVTSRPVRKGRECSSIPRRAAGRLPPSGPLRELQATPSSMAESNGIRPSANRRQACHPCPDRLSLQIADRGETSGENTSTANCRRIRCGHKVSLSANCRRLPRRADIEGRRIGLIFPERRNGDGLLCADSLPA